MRARGALAIVLVLACGCARDFDALFGPATDAGSADGAGPAPSFDAGADGPVSEDAGCTRVATCQAPTTGCTGGTCSFGCSGCGCACAAYTCPVGDSVTSCDARCADGTSCAVTCSASSPCTLHCEQGASCLLTCPDGAGATCELDCAVDAPRPCGGGVFACGRACP